MPGISTQTTTGYLDEIGWRYHVVDDTTLITGYRCPVPYYDYPITIEVRSGAHWLYLRALLQPDVGPAHRAAVLRFISRWNERCHQVRFLLVVDCVVIQAELPVAQCGIGPFMDALVAVCRYSQLVGVEVAVLATNPSARALYEAVAASEPPPGDRPPGPPRPVVDPADLDFDLTVNTLPE